ncbi:MAG: bifunctional NADH dehydrogenase FAD-containing subunit/selenide, water dikinase SelD, partial [Gammaproteobacteria bacterium]|nr:bifunctional NADH dehydrogenase FAD-containing subunit/selenide, water dikinase SelD [Gammaproteobacteria bacterium]
GFGLLGHLVEMVKASQVDVRLDLAHIPLLAGASDAVAAGITSSLQPQNLRLRRAIRNLERAVEHPAYPLLFDPQTDGGLLVGVPAETTADCIAALRALGYTRTSVIGEVLPASDALEPITIRTAAR